MHIAFKNSGYQHSINSIMLFQTEDQTPFWSEPLLHFCPQIDENMLMKGNVQDKHRYLDEVFSEIYEDVKIELDQKEICYNEYFSKYKCQIEDALSDAFDLNASELFNDLTGNITLNPICPRFLRERYFDVFYKSSERGALGLSLHEVIHYFWFHVWNGHFGDSYEEYETPSLKWILSEMVVEPIMEDRRLSSINPYFPRENGGCVYPYFQTMIIDGIPILEKMRQLYCGNQITDFMEASYDYCIKHENAIRQHIRMAESTF